MPTAKREEYEWDFFLAYARTDRSFATQLYDLLAGAYRVFLDVKCLRPGDAWDEALADAQRCSKVTVVLISPRTAAAYYQREEIAAAIDLARNATGRHRVVPVVLEAEAVEDSVIPYGLRRVHGIFMSPDMTLVGVAEELQDTIEKVQRRKTAVSTEVLPTDVKVTRHSSAITGTVITANFRLRSAHTAAYIREEAFISATVRLLVDEREVARQRLTFTSITGSIDHPFQLDGVACRFHIKYGIGFLWGGLTVAGQEIFSI
jgi:hypothetical protein